MLQSIVRNSIILCMLILCILPFYIIFILKNIGVNNFVIGILLLILLLVILNNIYGDYISNRTSIQLQKIEDKIKQF